MVEVRLGCETSTQCPRHPLSGRITTEKAVPSKVMHWVRVTSVLPGQSMVKMWQEGNGLFLLENTMSSLKPRAEGDKELLSLAPCPHVPGIAFLGMTSQPAIWGDFL